jgi:hypothetical protein
MPGPTVAKPKLQQAAELVWTAQPRQSLFLSKRTDECLYGGSAGGGKSDALIIFAIWRRMRYPGSRGIYFRRTYADLARGGAAMDRMRELLNGIPGMHWDSQLHRWTFPNGSTQDFGYLQYEDDKYNYQSAQYEDVVFDELTQLSESVYLYLISRCRTTIPGMKPMIRAATNPGNTGHLWVKRRFIDPAPPETDFELPLMEGQTIRRTACFIPATLKDNQVLMQRDPGYWERLMALPEHEKRALAYGDWDVFEGQFFGEWRRELHVCEPFAIPEHWTNRRLSVDFGYGAPWCAQFWVRDEDAWSQNRVRRWYCYREFYQAGVRDYQQAQRLAEAMLEDVGTLAAIPGVGDPSMWNRQANGVSIADVYANYGVSLTPARNDRVPGWQRVRAYLAPQQDGKPGIVFFSTCRNAIRTIPTMVYAENNAEDINSKSEDHCFIAGTLITTSRGEVPIEQVRVGDFVLTRQGYRRVLKSALTRKNAPVYTALFSNGTTLTGTGNHPIAISNGWSRLDALRYCDIIITKPGEGSVEWKNESLSSRESSIASTATTIAPAETSVTEAAATYTSKSGSPSTERCPQATTSTTLMATHSTTMSTTSWRWRDMPTDPCTGESASLKSARRREPRRLIGIALQRAGLGTGNTLRQWCAWTWKRLASNAGSGIWLTRTPSTKPASVPTIAGLPPAAPPALTTRSASAKYAGLSMPATDITREPPALESAAVWLWQLQSGGNANVYNLTVDDAHEYYANGILVHNCADACRYFLQSVGPLELPDNQRPDTLPVLIGQAGTSRESPAEQMDEWVQQQFRPKGRLNRHTRHKRP